MLNGAFDAWDDTRVDFYPLSRRAEIGTINASVHERVNNGVYPAGFAGYQHAYEHAVVRLFEVLDRLEARLACRRYLVGDILIEADWRPFPTLVRFDAVYATHFKGNLRRLEDYPNLSGYVRDLYQVPGVAETVDFDHIKRHDFLSHRHLNPGGLVPRWGRCSITRALTTARGSRAPRKLTTQWPRDDRDHRSRRQPAMRFLKRRAAARPRHAPVLFGKPLYGSGAGKVSSTPQAGSPIPTRASGGGAACRRSRASPNPARRRKFRDA